MLASRLPLLLSSLVLGLSVAVGVASADVVITDEADTVSVQGDTSVNLGTVTGGAPITRHVSFQLDCNSNQHVDANEALVLTESGSTVPPGGTASATTSRIVRPSTWPSDGSAGCSGIPNADDSGDSEVTLTPPTAPGTYTFVVRWVFTEDITTTPAVEANSAAADINGSTSTTVTYTLTVLANAAPAVPGVPHLAGGFVTPNAGVFDLGWDPSTDPNGDAVTYALQHKDANDPAFSLVASGLGSSSYAFGLLSSETEGTWTYRASASDGSLSSAFSDPSSAVKVDKTKPNAPTIAADRAPDYSAAGDDWFADSVTLSFSAVGDPDLADGSAGSGVDAGTLPAAASRSTTGPLSVSGSVEDNVGNESPSASKAVKVDAGAPSVSFSDCPAAPLATGAAVTIHYSAADDAGGSGLADPASGSFTLDTALDSEHQRSQSVTVHDNVGHAKTATCAYTVDSAPARPDAPTPDEAANRDGEFTLDWDAPADDDDPAAALRYTLEHRSAGGAWQPVAADLDATSYSFTGAAPEAEGTWSYRVSATDGIFASPASDPSSAVKVDKTRPNASVSAGTPVYSSAGRDWFKDSVTLTMSASDPDLADGSAGSGVDADTIDDPVTGSVNGSYTLAGSAADLVGNESSQASRTAYVDALPPGLTVTACPTAPVLRTSPVSITVSAMDESDGSGLDADPSGVVVLDTSTEGSITRSFTATDHVGHSATRQCAYSVYAYGWSNWLSPVNGSALNVVKAGQSVPLKFSLGGYRGMAGAIFAAPAAGASNPSSGAITCSTSGEPDTVEQTYTTNASGLTYDAVTDTYNYVWKTEKGWAGSCRQLVLKFADGYTRRANFNFTR